MNVATALRRGPLVAALAGALTASMAFAAGPVVAPAAHAEVAAAAAVTSPGVVAAPTDGGTIDAADRAAVIAGYQSRWLPALNVPFGWTGGNAETCAAGTPSPAAVQASLNAVNYVRDQADVPSVSLDASLSAPAQLAAIMMEANSTVDHYPSPAWRCYTQAGANAAARSNLTINPSGGTAVSVQRFMSDEGAHNASVGHREWILDAAVQEMGFGLTPRTQAMHLGPLHHSHEDRGEAVTWPTAGYFPAGLLPSSGRWSYGTYYSPRVDRDLTNARVSVAALGPLGPVPIPVSVDFQTGAKVVFSPLLPRTPASVGDDVTYRVRLTNVRTMWGEPAPDIEYDVTLVPDKAAHTWSTKPSISASPVAGEELTANPGTYSPAGVGETVEYTWSSRGKIVGTGQRFTPGFAQVGAPLTLETKIRTRSGSTGAATVTRTANVTYATAPTNTQAPTLTGTPQEGQTLRVSTGSWDPAPSRYEFQWYRNNQPIRGATARTYVPNSDDVEEKIHALVTALSPTGAAGSATSNHVTITAAAAGPPPATVDFPTISGPHRVGETLRLDPGTWYGAAGFSYQWYVNNRAVPGATAETFTIPASALTTRVHARVAAFNGAGRTTSVNSNHTTLVVRGLAPRESRPLSLTGKPKVGEKITVVVPAFVPAPGKVVIEWLRAGKVVKGRMGASYVLAKADRGKKIAVRVRTSMRAYEPRVLTKSLGSKVR